MITYLDVVKKELEAEQEEYRQYKEFLELAGRLDWSPKSNWVEREGGLPKFIEDIALALIRDHGFSRSRAIATAINRVKRWARGGDGVKADTVTKSLKALAAWELLKKKAAARRAKKK